MKMNRQQKLVNKIAILLNGLTLSEAQGIIIQVETLINNTQKIKIEKEE